MKKILMNTILFKDFNYEEIERALKCLDYIDKNFYDKDVYYNESITPFVGIVLEGIADLIYLTEEGKEHILERYEMGDCFLLYGCDKYDQLIEASGKTRIFFMNIQEVYHPGRQLCCLRSRILENLLLVMDKQNKMLNEKVKIYTEKGLRERIISYLNTYYEKKSAGFEKPFNRQELSDYLSCDRSALSRELSRMQKENLIKIDGSKIKILSNKIARSNYMKDKNR